MWVAEFKKWAGIEAHIVARGRDRKLLTKRDFAAYDANVRVSSYGLLGSFTTLSDPLQDLIIFDEMHNLRGTHTKASENARLLMANNPGAAALGLTATPIPTKTEQVWNPVNTLFPNWQGRPRNGYDIPWGFLSRYCARIENEYGVTYTGPRDEEAMEQLREALKPYVRRVEPCEIEKYLPPVDAQPLYIDDYDIKAAAKQFIEDALLEETSHVAIVTYKRETSQQLYTEISKKYSKAFAADSRAVYHFTGSYAPEARAATLEHFQASKGGVLVCTSESIRESIDLSFVKAALVLEWRTSPAQALQLLGRFRRPNGDPRLNRVRYLTTPDDTQRAKLLSHRLDALAVVLASDNSQFLLQQVFNAQEVSDADLDLMLESITAKRKSIEQTEQW